MHLGACHTGPDTEDVSLADRSLFPLQAPHLQGRAQHIHPSVSCGTFLQDVFMLPDTRPIISFNYVELGPSRLWAPRTKAFVEALLTGYGGSEIG